MKKNAQVVACLVSLSSLYAASAAPPSGPIASAADALRQLEQDSGGAVAISVHPATGVPRFLRFPSGAPYLGGVGAQERAKRVFERYAAAFGISDPTTELPPAGERIDKYGRARVTFEQRWRGIPVFAGVVRAHFDPEGRLTVINGTLIPGIAVDPDPTVPAESAAAAAVRAVASTRPESGAGLAARDMRLVVFRAGLLAGVPGTDHLTYEIEVGDDAGVLELVFIDAHTGKVVDEITENQETLTRVIHQPQFNSVVIWTEGQSLPYTSGDATNDGQVNGLIQTSADVYNLYSHLSDGNFLSWDGASGTMNNVWKSVNVSCPNANWNGTTTNFCNGVAADDVVAHEWTHAYTQSTHGLIYQWQPGALNEAYSDMFGETVDLLDGVGTDSPSTARTAADCSTFGGVPPPGLTVSTPPPIARAYSAGGATFNPAPPLSVTGLVQLVNDVTGSVTDACEALVGFTPGRIALVDRGTCTFPVKALNAQNAGASAMILVNTDDSLITLSGSNPAITIPSICIKHSDGNLLRSGLVVDVSATIALTPATSASVRWMVSEDAFSFGGPIRDMWNPTCFADPGKVSDGQYQCTTTDGGGVHTNSGVPNHAYALIVDGGTYNGHSVAAVGLTKAAHIYWRAMSVYQVPATDFADHADSLQQSCADLIGVPLSDPWTGGASGQTISPADCSAVAEAMLAVEMAAHPPCNFTTLLRPDPAPRVCENTVFADSFEVDPSATWTRSNSGVSAEYLPRDWEWAANVPTGGSGRALFALDSLDLGTCQPGGDQSGVMSVVSPPIVLSGAQGVTFRHSVATELHYDGGNVQIAVNSGPFTLVPASAFIFNPYNDTLFVSGNTNPMAGQPAWSGSDQGSVVGAWGTSQLDLTGIASSMDTIRLRFDFGVDGCNGLVGWYVDDVAVCTLVPAAGRVPDGMTLAKAAGGNVTLSWAASCLASDTDFEVYEGTLGGTFTSHVPRLCSTGGATTLTLSPSAANAYYLVVPRNATREGSYGTDGNGVPRPPSSTACVPQAVATSCP